MKITAFVAKQTRDSALNTPQPSLIVGFRASELSIISLGRNDHLRLDIHLYPKIFQAMYQALDGSFLLILVEIFCTQVTIGLALGKDMIGDDDNRMTDSCDGPFFLPRRAARRLN